MTGIDSWSTTAATNATADGGSINFAENQAPSTVNNSARQLMADVRARNNDLIWYQYGTGDQGSGNLAVPTVYASGTSFTITGADVTTIYTAARRVRAVGVSTGTIYGSISSSSYNGGNSTTTVNVTWDSGSLSNETLVVSLSQIPVTGDPVHVNSLAGILPVANGGTGVAAPSGTYTPTVSALVNLDSTPTASTAQWMRVGSVVTVSGRITGVDPTAALSTSYQLSLPVASDMNTDAQLCGTAVSASAAGMSATVSGNDIADTAKITWLATSTTLGSNDWRYIYTYLVL